jgi:hypothetical protein
MYKLRHQVPSSRQTPDSACARRVSLQKESYMVPMSNVVVCRCRCSRSKTTSPPNRTGDLRADRPGPRHAKVRGRCRQQKCAQTPDTGSLHSRLRALAPHACSACATGELRPRWLQQHRAPACARRPPACAEGLVACARTPWLSGQHMQHPDQHRLRTRKHH